MNRRRFLQYARLPEWLTALSGEYRRACPMGIPVLELKRHMNAIIRELFDYRAGTSPEAVPPLLSFQAEETNIMERNF